MSEQTAIDEHIEWLEKQIAIEKRLDYKPREEWTQGMIYGVNKNLNEVLKHARSARQRAGEEGRE